MVHPVLFYLPGERLSHAELAAARLDGMVVELGDGFVPADTVEGPEARALAVASLVTPGLAAFGPTAAWIHGARDAAPIRQHAMRASPTRLRLSQNSRLVYHDTFLPESERQQIGPVTVSAPPRTLTDLVRGANFTPDYVAWAQSLVQQHPQCARAAFDTLTALRRTPGRRSGLELLRRLIDSG